jgi:hypothetical protein
MENYVEEGLQITSLLLLRKLQHVNYLESNNDLFNYYPRTPCFSSMNVSLLFTEVWGTHKRLHFDSHNQEMVKSPKRICPYPCRCQDCTSCGLDFAEHAAISSIASVHRSPDSRCSPSLIRTCHFITLLPNAHYFITARN